MLNNTALGLKIRAVGEAPNAAESVGVNVKYLRYLALMLSGVFAGLGGAFLSMAYVSWFSAGMTAGRGWIALAAEAMGRSTVAGSVASSYLFGLTEALSNTLSILNIPSELIRIVPYVATVICITIYSIIASNKKLKGV